MANKETKEFLTIPSKFIDSTYKSLEDGNFKFLEDFGNYVDDLLAIQPGVQGINLVDDENATMTIAEANELKVAMSSQMPNVPENDRFDLTEGMSGLLAFFRIGWRKGYERGLAAANSEKK